jgi:bifunctional DNase/RNase
VIAVDVTGVALVPPETAPVLLLRERTGARRWLLIVVGMPEADALVRAQRRQSAPRPGTVELMIDVITALGHQLDRVEVTELRNSNFVADLVLDGGTRISARPSDAVALALRSEVPVTVAESVFDDAGVELDLALSGDDAGENGPTDPAEEIAEFRHFLDVVDPSDFGEPPPGGEEDR